MGRLNSKWSKSSKSPASIDSQESSASCSQLQEAKERRQLALLKLQQLKLIQELEQRQAQLENEAQTLEFQLATAREKVWSFPVFNLAALDASLRGLETACHGSRGLEGLSRFGRTPTPTATSQPVRHTISPSIELVVMKNQSWNPLAAERISRLTT